MPFNGIHVFEMASTSPAVDLYHDTSTMNNQNLIIIGLGLYKERKLPMKFDIEIHPKRGRN